MKPLDCDQVFDVLTRGPFPSGDASDGPVEQHLRCCHECRTLAEALRPAVELFHEAIDAEEGRDLPGYHGTLESELGDGSFPRRAGVAQLVMAAIAAETAIAPARVVAPRSSWWEALAVDRYRLTGAVAIGALLALVFWGLDASKSPSPMTRSTRPVRFSPTDQGLITLTSLRLPASCLPSSGDLTGGAAHAWHCCTECHSAPQGNSSASPNMLLAVVQSCRACHP